MKCILIVIRYLDGNKILQFYKTINYIRNSKRNKIPLNYKQCIMSI